MPIRPFTRKLDVYFFNLRNIVFNFWSTHISCLNGLLKKIQKQLGKYWQNLISSKFKTRFYSSNALHQAEVSRNFEGKRVYLQKTR